MIHPLGKAVVGWLRRQKVRRFLRAAAADCDGFLASFPKCGRTWLRFLLSHYFVEMAGLELRPDLATTFQVLPNFDRDPVRGIPAFRFAAHRPGIPLLLVSHLPYDEALFQDRPVIFLVRDPRDIIVSAYFHATRHKHRFDGPVGAFFDDDSYGLPALIAYWNGWAKGLAGRGHIVLSYERMLRDTEAVVVDLLRFLDIPVHPQALERAIAAARFDRMQQQEKVQGIPGHDYDRVDNQSLRMRSGKAGGFSECLSEEEAELVIARCRRGLTDEARNMLGQAGLNLNGAETLLQAKAG